jgi:GTP:adenosylcobinamide-phosphate guanylyltransferase
LSGPPSIVLAGGKAGPELAAQIGTSVRALAVVHGRRLLDIVVDALAAGAPLGTITVVGGVPESDRYHSVADQGDFVSNLFAGLAACGDAEWVLIASCDMPFLTGDVVAEFVSRGLRAGADSAADVVYPIVRVADCYARYPGIKRTAIRLREGEFTGGNVMLARPSFLMERRQVLSDAYSARKQPFRLAGMLGFGTVARLAVSQILLPSALNIGFLERQVGRLIGGRVAALVCATPEIATDLDRASDFATAANYPAAGSAPAP